MTEPGADFATAPVVGAGHRLVNGAPARLAGLYKGDIDGVFVAAVYELSSPVDRVHQPIAVPVASKVVGGGFAFLRDHRQLPGKFAERPLDDLAGDYVRLSDRGRVGFALQPQRLLAAKVGQGSLAGGVTNGVN